MKLTKPALRRLSAVSIGVLLVSAAVALPAYAAPPPNDSITSPTVVRAIPARIAQDTSQATADRTDGDCVRGSSVWYRFRPTTTRRLRVVTIGSDFDTILALFRGPRATRTLRQCSDDTSDEFTSAVEERFVAGQTYWIAVSACCNRRATGGNSVLTIYPPSPAGATTTIDTVESGGVSGRLFVSGSTVCDTPSVAFPFVFVSQRVGTGVARGGGSAFIAECTTTTTHWTMPLDTETSFAFQPGPISLTYVDQVDDGFSFFFSDENTTTMTVVDNPVLRPHRPRAHAGP
jgi:hypothetical protein